MEKPILFNTEMVKAILAGRKTQTRRLIRPQPAGQLSYIFGGSHPGKWTYMSRSDAKAWDVDESVIHEEDGKYWTPPCNWDDVLYVRETWNYGYVDSDWKEGCPPEHWFEELDWKGKDHDFLREISRFWYLADDDEPLYDLKWKPSIHMPKAAARIWLKVKRVRVERLQDITEEDAKAEGLSKLFDYLSDEEFQNSIVPFATGAKKEAFGWTNYLHGDSRDTYGYSDYQSPIDSFGSLWNSTIMAGELEQYGWDANPWVWVIEFERVEGKHDDD